MTAPIHIVAVSARTPVGLHAAPTAAALRARISRLALHPFLLDPANEALRCARDARLPPDLLGPARIQALAASALADVLFSVVIPADVQVPVLLALPERRPGFQQSDAARLVAALNECPERGTARSVHETAAGHAGALQGIAEALSYLRSGASSLHAVGGADSYLETETLQWLEDERMLAHRDRRGGFPPGEAAAFVLLASDDARRSMRLPSLATVVEAACTQEPRTRDSDAGFLGEALSRAILQATQSLALPNEQVVDIFCDINGERMRTDDWSFALLRSQHVFRDATRYVTPLSEIGDIGAAWGAVSVALAVEHFRRAYTAGTRSLVWGASWQGLRAACVLAKGSG